MAETPPLEDAAALPAAAETLPVSPVIEIHSPALRSRILMGRKAKNPVDRRVYVEKIRVFLFSLKELPSCISIKNKSRPTQCSCFHDAVMGNDEMDALVQWLFLFALKPRKEQVELVSEWIKYNLFIGKLALFSQENKNKTYILPSSVNQQCCKNTLCRLIGFGGHRWMTCVKIASGKTPLSHAASQRKPNNINMTLRRDMLSFFAHMAKLASPRATLVVREIVNGKVQTTLKNKSDFLLELPSSTTKRSLYGRFVRDRGWNYLVNATSAVAVPLPEQEQKPIPSWSTFLKYWGRFYPLLVICKPREDVCGECYIYANRHKYIKRKTGQEVLDNEHLEGDTDDESVLEEEENSPAVAATGDEESMQDPIIEQEDMILKAAKHVEMARIQRQYYQDAKTLSRTTAHLPPSQRSLCIVADYAQNMGVPSFGYEQPGETYYYSPMNAYCFGVVDCTVTLEDHLHAYIYMEDQAKKGGNNVASLLWLHLQSQRYTATEEPFKELTFIFDNCGGQNKNNMVLRMLFFIVKMGVAKVARASFLVRGHTKNDCDRLFNLMKKDIRKTNVYTPKQLLQSIKHKQVTAVPVDSSVFKDWDALEDKHIRKAAGLINTNHMFEVNIDVDNGNSMTFREAHGYKDTVVKMVKKEFVSSDKAFWLSLTNTLTTLKPTGIQDIKWKELHDKWKPLVPEEYWKSWKYYATDLSQKQRENIKSNTAKSKAARKERSRTANEPTTATTAAPKP